MDPVKSLLLHLQDQLVTMTHAKDQRKQALTWSTASTKLFTAEYLAYFPDLRTHLKRDYVKKTHSAALMRQPPKRNHHHYGDDHASISNPLVHTVSPLNKLQNGV